MYKCSAGHIFAVPAYTPKHMDEEFTWDNTACPECGTRDIWDESQKQPKADKERSKEKWSTT